MCASRRKTPEGRKGLPGKIRLGSDKRVRSSVISFHHYLVTNIVWALNSTLIKTVYVMCKIYLGVGVPLGIGGARWTRSISVATRPARYYSEPRKAKLLAPILVRRRVKMNLCMRFRENAHVSFCWILVSSPRSRREIDRDSRRESTSGARRGRLVQPRSGLATTRSTRARRERDCDLSN